VQTRTRSLIGVLALVLAAGAVPAASGAQGGHDPDPRAFLQKQATLAHAQAQAQSEEPGEEDEDEAGVIRLRAEYAQSIQAAPGTTFPVAGTLAAQRAAAALPVVGGQWSSPTDKPFINDPINRGGNFGVGWGLVTGRMTALTESRGVVYAGSASGGVWRSYDQGRHWRPVNDGLPRLAVGALATDPTDGSIWVGTGEANNAAENQYGTGVYRLASGASTWRRVGGNALFGAGSYKIIWARGYVYLATNHGLYRRPVGAPTSREWIPVLQPNGPQVYPPSSSVTDIIPVPGSGDRRLLAVVGWSGYSDPPETEANGFYVGSGSAASFHRITPTGDIDPANIGRTTFSSSQGRLYAVVATSNPDPALTGTLIGEGVFRSDHGPAGPWVLIADTNKLAASDSALEDQDGSYFPGIQGDYNQNILADPNDPDHLYLLLEEVFESTDGGATWLAVGPYWNFDITCNPTGETPYRCPRTTHPDQHAAMISGGQFWAGNDGGVWRRPLGWHQRGRWSNLNAGLHTTQNYSIDIGRVPQGYAYWGGLQDNGESYTRTGMNRVEQAFTGDGGDTIVDPANGNRAVEEYVYLDMYKTVDAAVNLEEISPSCLTATDPPDPCDPNPRFIAPITKDIMDTTHWVAGGQYVWDDTAGWYTVCNGTNGCDWHAVYDTGDGHSVTALATSGDTTYAAWCGPCNPPDFGRGLSTNAGGTWHELALDGVANRYITSVAIDPGNASHAYISLGSYSRRWIPTAGDGHVYETTDAGQTWRDITGDLPDAPVYAIALLGQRLVAGTEVGALVASTGGSHAGGLSWARLGRGLPRVTIWDLVTRPDGTVAAGTHGRGDWVTHLR
jgi:hypothetical protein